MRIHRCVAAADDRYAVAVAYHHFVARHIAAFVKAYASQESDGLSYSRVFDAGYVKPFWHAGTGADEYGVEAVGEEIVDGEVLAGSRVEVYFTPSFSILLISRLTTSLGRRYSGMPNFSMPPGSAPFRISRRQTLCATDRRQWSVRQDRTYYGHPSA